MLKSVVFTIYFVGHLVYANPICKNVGNDPLFDQIRSEIKTCKAHDVHITFDDGPSLIATENILKELKKRNTKASFFISTTNLEKGSELQNLASNELADGHVVGDHGYEHNAYDLRIVNGNVEDKGYGDAEASKQINKSVELLNKATNGNFGQQKIKMFRFPYGRGAMPSPAELNYMEAHEKIVFQSENYSERLQEYRKSSRAVAAISEKGFSHLGWNHDSQDFKYGVTNDSEVNVKDFVKGNIQRLCASKESIQVALFHDIKAINVKAIPLIIDVGRCLGLNFISAKEMLQSTERLAANGVLIPKDFQLKGAVKNPNDALDVIIGKLAGQTCQLQIPPTHKACTSSNGKTYKHCEGEDSICFNGEWESRATIILEGKCNF